MSDQQLLHRITVDSEVMMGKPVIRGTRLTVDHILNLLAHGADPQGLIDEYPGLSRDDVSACLLFAARSLANLSFMPLTGAMS